ncbi:sodium- and chloride-dependent glycine transporter 2-like isoform X2 [Ornithodoros turicata]|uniref:sodium- and chloride-dependent glycine transporter 2-like isoform X2 n=1 Tax=Ornithodoros turicata TaxID=34597 RepID=UPI003138F91C
MDGESSKYDGKVHQFVTFAVLLIGKNTIFKLPRLIFIHGGVPFLLAYTTFTVSVVMPIMQLESTLSQFSGLGHLGIFDTTPVFRGLGYTLTYYFTLGMITFGTESSYGAVFLLNVFHSPLPWASCSQPWVHEDNECYVQQKHMMLCSSLLEGLVKQFSDYGEKEGVPVTTGEKTSFIPRDVYANVSAEPCINGTLPSIWFFVKHKVYRLRSNPWEVGSVHPQLALSAAILWLIAFCVARKGIQRAKYALYILAGIYLVTMAFTIGHALVLKGAGVGMSFLFGRTLQGLSRPTMWRDALRISVSNFSLFGSPFVNVTRFNPFKNDFRYVTATVIAMELTTNIVCGVLLSVFVSYLAETRGVDIDHVLGRDPNIQHEIVPEALTVIDPSGTSCAIYFLWILTNALGCMIMGPEVMFETFSYDVPEIASVRDEFTFFFCAVFYLLGLLLSTQAGFTLTRLISRNLELLAAIIMLTEVAVFLCVYGTQRIMVDFYTMIGEYPSVFVRISWVAIIPSLLVVWSEVASPLGRWRPESSMDIRRYQRLLTQFNLWSTKTPTKSSLKTTQTRHGEVTSDTSAVRESVTTERSVSFAPDVPASPLPGAFNEALARRCGLPKPPERLGNKPRYYRPEDILQELVAPTANEEDEELSCKKELSPEEEPSPVLSAPIQGTSKCGVPTLEPKKPKKETKKKRRKTKSTASPEAQHETERKGETITSRNRSAIGSLGSTEKFAVKASSPQSDRDVAADPKVLAGSLAPSANSGNERAHLH